MPVGLPGFVQTVLAGELLCLWLALRLTTNFGVHVTGKPATHEGWYCQRYGDPSGEYSELWAPIGQEIAERALENSIIIFAFSHLEADEAVQGQGFSWLARGNAAAHILAADGAARVRRPQIIRFTVLRRRTERSSSQD